MFIYLRGINVQKIVYKCLYELGIPLSSSYFLMRNEFCHGNLRNTDRLHIPTEGERERERDQIVALNESATRNAGNFLCNNLPEKMKSQFVFQNWEGQPHTEILNDFYITRIYMKWIVVVAL